MKESLAKRIENYLKRNGRWVSKGTLEELFKHATYIKRGKVCHYLAENGNRRCREMVQGKKSNGEPCPIILEVRPAGKSVEYRYKKEEVKVFKPQISIKIINNIPMAVYN